MIEEYWRPFQHVISYGSWGVVHKDQIYAAMLSEHQALCLAAQLNYQRYQIQIANRINMSEDDRYDYSSVVIAVLMADGKTYNEAKSLLDRKEVIVYNDNFDNWNYNYAGVYNIKLHEIAQGKNKQFRLVEYDGYRYIIYYIGDIKHDV